MEHLDLRECLKSEPHDFCFVEVPDYVTLDVTHIKQEKIVAEDVPKSDYPTSNVRIKEECVPRFQDPISNCLKHSVRTEVKTEPMECGELLNKSDVTDMRNITEDCDIIKNKSNPEEFRQDTNLMEFEQVNLKTEDNNDRRPSHELDKQKEAEQSDLKMQIGQTQRLSLNKMVIVYKCKICHYQTKNTTDFKVHFIGHMDSTILLHCTRCSYQTKEQARFSRHVLTHQERVSQQNKTSFTGKFSQEHVGGAHEPSEEVEWLSCSQCEYRTITDRELKEHSLHHDETTSSNLLRVSFGDFPTFNKSSLKKTIPRNRRIIYKCGTCEYQTKLKKCMDGHLLRHKDTKDVEMFRCFDCDFESKYKSSLNNHIVNNNSSRVVGANMLNCRLCEFQTERRCTLKKHLLAHTLAAALHVCLDCNFQTKLTSELNSHMTNRHQKQC